MNCTRNRVIMLKEDDSSLLDDEPIVFKGGTLSLSTEEDDADEHTSFLNNRKSSGKYTHSNNFIEFLLLIDTRLYPIHFAGTCSLVTPWPGENPKSYFCYRDELVTRTLAEIKEFLMEEDPNDIQGVWLLTE